MAISARALPVASVEIVTMMATARTVAIMAPIVVETDVVVAAAASGRALADLP